MHMAAIPATLLATLLTAAIGLGGGIYECLLIDRVWPDRPTMIQPQHGGIDRKIFWGPLHAAYELLLIASLWVNWSAPVSRLWIGAAIGVHMATRIWSFAYFIPAAIRFERDDDGKLERPDGAQAWVRLSRLRLITEVAAAGALVMAMHGAMTA